MPYRTLADLEGELRAALGYAAAGASAGVNSVLMRHFLQQAQHELYWTHDWVRLRRYEILPVGVGQVLIDYPVNANPERIKAISVLRGGVWSPPLTRGIKPELYTTQENRTWPQLWEPYEQIELWPAADQPYSIRVFYVKNLDRFTQNNDRATIDDLLIMQHATARAKGHFRHPDAPMYLQALDNTLTRLKAKNWGKTVFNPREYEDEALVKPVVV